MTRRRVTMQVNEVKLIMDFDLASHVQKEMCDVISSGVDYENATSAFLRRVVRPGDTVVDVGAHVGCFTLLLSALVGPTGKVLAFEPNPENYQRLLNHLSLNGLCNVVPFHMAVGASCGVVDLWVNKDNDGGHALYNPGLISSNTKSIASPQRYPVWCTTLDAIGLPDPVRVIKIDTEGAEHSVMRGYAGCPEYVVSEIHRPGLMFLGSSEEKYRQYMDQRGYQTNVPDLEGRLIDLTGRSANEHAVFNVVFAGGHDGNA